MPMLTPGMIMRPSSSSGRLTTRPSRMASSDRASRFSPGGGSTALDVDFVALMPLQGWRRYASLAGLPAYTRMFGQVFTPAFTLVFVLKTLFSSLAVALIPTASALHPGPGMTELGGLARMFALLLLIELVSLMGNYYG